MYTLQADSDHEVDQIKMGKVSVYPFSGSTGAHAAVVAIGPDGRTSNVQTR